MSTTFPTTLDVFTDPPASPTTTALGLSTPAHSVHHKALIDAVAALEVKVGVNSSAVTTTLDYKASQHLIKTNNLSDLTSASTARTNLALGTVVTLDVASSGNASAGQVVKGDDTRLTDGRAPSGSAGGVLGGTYPSPSFAVDMATQSELDAAVALLIPLTQKAANSGVASLDSAGDLVQTQIPTAGGATAGSTVTGWSYSGTWTATTDPTNTAQGTALLVTHTPIYNYAGTAGTGPLPATANSLNVGYRALVQVEGRATYNFAGQALGPAPAAFQNHLITRNQASTARDIPSGFGFVNSPIFEADGASIAMVGALRPVGFLDQQHYFTKNTGTLNGTTNTVYIYSFVSAPNVSGTAHFSGRIAFDVRDVDTASTIANNISAAYDDGTGVVDTQVGLNVPRLTGATANYGILCNSPVILNNDTVTLTALPLSMIASTGTFTLNFASASLLPMFDMAGTVKYQQDGSAAAAFQFARNVATIQNLSTAVGVDLNQLYSYVSQPTIQADTKTDVTAGVTTHFAAFPTYTRINSGVLAASQDTGFSSFLTVNTGATVATRLGVFVANATGTGTLTTQIGIDIETLNKGTTNVSLRSQGAAAEMRHNGPGVFGANAAPTNASVALEVQSTTKSFLLPRMTTTQRDALTAVNGMMIYNSTTNTVQARVNGTWTSL